MALKVNDPKINDVHSLEILFSLLSSLLFFLFSFTSILDFSRSFVLMCRRLYDNLDNSINISGIKEISYLNYFSVCKCIYYICIYLLYGEYQVRRNVNPHDALLEGILIKRKAIATLIE